MTGIPKLLAVRPAPTPLLAFALLCGLTTIGCKKDPPPPPEKPAVAVPTPAKPVPAKPAPLGERMPVGPKQVVVPGQGITAMRFGATVETLERHMQAPCDVKTESRCLYIKQAIEFSLDKGVMVRAKVYGRDRLVPGMPDKAFGTFHGGMAPDIVFGLHRHIVQEEFGKPERSETVGEGTKLGLVARDFYPGLVLEYDKIENGNTVLAAMEVVPVAAPTAPGSGGAAAKAP